MKIVRLKNPLINDIKFAIASENVGLKNLFASVEMVIFHLLRRENVVLMIMMVIMVGIIVF